MSTTDPHSLQQTILRYVIILAAGILALTIFGLFIEHHHHNKSNEAVAPQTSSQNPFEAVTLNVPAKIATTPIVTEQGKTTDLASLHGRTVVLADAMTSCQEECPITTGALITVYNSLKQRALLKRVTVLELSVDPARDTPARLAAYSKLTGVQFELATGTKADLARIWHYFGVSYWQVKEGTPPDIDWYTHKAYAYDIDHSDDVFVLDASGNERFFVDGDANVSGQLSKPLKALLDSQGHQNLTKPGENSWTPTDLLAEVSTVVGQNIPLARS